MKSLYKYCLILLIFLPYVILYAQGKKNKQNPKPPSVFDIAADFTGWTGDTLDFKKFKEIRIGYFAPEESGDLISNPMLNAASLAIEEANKAGGFYGIPFRLVKRWSNDPWKAGSKEMIKLVYQDSVWAVIGSIDGSTTHIAEQVITKARIPLISPVSADPTLTYINIPWIFRLPPDDKIQAEKLVKESAQKFSLKRIGIITSTDHDGRIFAEEILTSMKAEGIAPVFHFKLTPGKIDYEQILNRLKSFKSDGIILRLTLEENLYLLKHFDTNRFSIPVFIPWIPGLQREDLVKRYNGPIAYLNPFSQTGNPAFTSFSKIYQECFDKSPTPGAAYVYDAVNILIQSLKISGLNRAKLRDAISKMDVYKGVTGNISWDNGGGNKAESEITILHNKKIVNK
jgi:branched-chain amino acid transport system substrate-binding protein